jgi:hypothetical protein
MDNYVLPSPVPVQDNSPFCHWEDAGPAYLFPTSPTFYCEYVKFISRKEIPMEEVLLHAAAHVARHIFRLITGW